MIEPIEESEEDDFEPEKENTKEDPQSADCMTHTLAGHVNPQAMKVEESLKQQSVTILIKTRSPIHRRGQKLAGNTPGDCRKKIRRLTVRMPEVARLAGVGRLNRLYLRFWVLSVVDTPKLVAKPPVPEFYGYV
ncbi:hypothetical protein GW17_00016105 [Ensete ventricosum]|nr:hypothetical protein GW17_00016105 [Ensete ventricosum]